MALKPELIKQYQIDDMPGLLLSPRSRCKSNMFDACEHCVNGMRQIMRLSCGLIHLLMTIDFVVKLHNMCLYEFTMMYEKKYKTFNEMSGSDYEEDCVDDCARTEQLKKLE